jgi:Polysaccharide lyase family 4, domain III
MPAVVRRLRTAGELGRIAISWEGEAYRPLVDHYAIYAAESPDGPQTLIGKTVYTTFTHARLGGAAKTFYYRVVVVDAAGDRSRPSPAVRGTSVESVTVSGRPIATVGAFDHKSLELTLAPNGYAQYPTRFPNGVDSTGTEWSYIHPGPTDAWAGRKAHRFTLRFTLDTVPANDPWLAIWLVDSHATTPGAVVLGLNGTRVREVALEKGATRGSLEGDATLPGSPLKPSYVELPLPRAALKAGENILTIDKNTGSWHVYDALGIFAPRLASSVIEASPK